MPAKGASKQIVSCEAHSIYLIYFTIVLLL